MRDVRQILADMIPFMVDCNPVLANEAKAWIAANPVEDPGDDPTAVAILCQNAQERPQMASPPVSVIDFLSDHRNLHSAPKHRQDWYDLIAKHGLMLMGQVAKEIWEYATPTDVAFYIKSTPEQRHTMLNKHRFSEALKLHHFANSDEYTSQWASALRECGAKNTDDLLSAVRIIGKWANAERAQSSVSLCFPNQCIGLIARYRSYMQDRAQMKG